MECVRLPRFKRSPNIPSFRLTERDLDILRHVQRHRFLRSSHLVALIAGSRQQLLRRLQYLFHHGYLDRPRAQLEYFHRGGSHSIVYGLADKGAGIVAKRHSPASNIGRLFLEHGLLVSDAMVAIQVACQNRSDLRLAEPDDFPMPARVHRTAEPFRWSVKLEGLGKLGVVPDRVFVLDSGDRGNPFERVLYFLEADCGTMPVFRRTLTQSSFYRKLLAYEASWSQEIHRRRFGFRRFRVLTVTNSAERMNHLIEACGKLQRGRGLFLFTDRQSFTSHQDCLALPCQSGRGGAETLV